MISLSVFYLRILHGASPNLPTRASVVPLQCKPLKPLFFFRINDTARLVPSWSAKQRSKMTGCLVELSAQRQCAHSSALSTASAYNTPCSCYPNLYHDRFYRGTSDEALGFVHVCDDGFTKSMFHADLDDLMMQSQSSSLFHGALSQ